MFYLFKLYEPECLHVIQSIGAVTGRLLVMQSAWLRATVACLVSIGFAVVVSAQPAPWPACVARGATLEPSRIEVQDGDSGCVLFFALGNVSRVEGLGQAGSSSNGSPGVLLLNSSAMVAGASAFGS
jgi:hypothetical protein